MVQQQLFPKQSQNDKDIAIGNGYSVEWVAAKLVRVCRYGVPFKVVEIKAGIDRRRLVIELVLEGGIIKSRLAKALNVSRQSIDTWIDTFKKSGFEGLVNSYKGNIRTGRVENSGKLPIGNKARQLEEARRLKRESWDWGRPLNYNFLVLYKVYLLGFGNLPTKLYRNTHDG